jgi:hypothetical protein
MTAIPELSSSKPLRRITLPSSGNAVAGPLNTVATDTEGNTHYTDEINHTVSSLSGNGFLRWQRRVGGSGASSFIHMASLSDSSCRERRRFLVWGYAIAGIDAFSSSIAQEILSSPGLGMAHLRISQIIYDLFRNLL